MNLKPYNFFDRKENEQSQTSGYSSFISSSQSIDLVTPESKKKCESVSILSISITVVQ
jgi:hypothetical protein